MPAKKNDVLAKLGTKYDKHVQQHAKDETRYGIIKLPGGIKNGIAQLMEVGFVEMKTGPNKGKPCFRGMGSMLEPETISSVDGPIRVKGLHTSIVEPMCDTKNDEGKVTTFDEHLAVVMNHLRMLGGEEFTADVKKVSDLQGLCETLEQIAPCFKVVTEDGKVTPKYPNPKVWERWHGTKGLEDYVPSDEDTSGDDESEEVKGEEAVPTKPVGKKVTGKKDLKDKAEKAEEAEAESTDDPDFNDLDSLAERAQADDDDAKETLGKYAEEAGISEEDVAGAEDWAAVVEMIRGTQEGAEIEEEGTEEEAITTPEKGEVWLYRPVDPKTKKPATKPVKVEMMAVNVEKETADVKNLTTKVIIKGVPFSKLEAQG